MYIQPRNRQLYYLFTHFLIYISLLLNKKNEKLPFDKCTMLASSNMIIIKSKYLSACDYSFLLSLAF